MVAICGETGSIRDAAGRIHTSHDHDPKGPPRSKVGAAFGYG